MRRGRDLVGEREPVRLAASSLGGRYLLFRDPGTARRVKAAGERGSKGSTRSSMGGTESDWAGLPRSLRHYVLTSYAAALFLIAISLGSAMGRLGGTGAISGTRAVQAVVLVVIAAAGERIKIRFSGAVTQNLNTAVQVGLLLSCGPPAPLLIGLGAAPIVWLGAPHAERRLPRYKRCFNQAHTLITLGLASVVLATVVQPGTLPAPGRFAGSLPLLVGFLFMYYLLDVTPVLLAVSLHRRLAPWRVWWRWSRSTLPFELACALIGVAAAITWRFDPLAIGLVVVPVAALWWAFRASDRARRRGDQMEIVLRAAKSFQLQQGAVGVLRVMAEAAQTLVGAASVAGYLPGAGDPAWLERAIVLPEGAADVSPDRLEKGSGESGIAVWEGESGAYLLVPFALEEAGVVGVVGALRLGGLASGLSASDGDARAILAAQAAIALANVTLHERALITAAADGLTGLANHKQFQARLEEETMRAARHERPLSLVVVDLDNFRIVNNTHGHGYAPGFRAGARKGAGGVG